MVSVDGENVFRFFLGSIIAHLSRSHTNFVAKF